MKYPVLLLLAFLSFNVQAQETLLPQQVLASSLKHYPEILRAKANIVAAGGDMQAAQGAFDPRIDQTANLRTSGFYDGRQVDTRVVKPFAELNSEVYGGYRVSDGNFPIYEDQLITNEQGEFLIGMELSLLRDRAIDNRRLQLNNSKIGFDIAEIDENITKLAVQHDALYHYWQWVAAGQVLKVYRSLVDIAQVRQKGFEQKVREGDVAEIYLTENRQYILKRETQLNEALRNFEIAAQKLGIYLRDAEGNIMPPGKELLPKNFPEAQIAFHRQQAVEAISQRPELARLREQIKIQQNESQMAKNLMLPEANLQMEYSQDNGAGDFRRDPAESVLKFNVSIPLERNIGKGRLQKAQATISKLELEEKLLKDKLTVELQNAFTTLEMAEKFVTLTTEETVLAQKLEDAERKRFTNGESDFFLLNIREENTAEARKRQIRAKESYYIALARLYALTMNFKALGI